ncbi:3H domain-containing protein [Treponema saccharophilum]|uniref:3H domain-containing protein n=1 Tax=Treponema saccharophilum TaxID=165 RepID=UPI003863AB6C
MEKNARKQSGEERRREIIRILSSSKSPVSGSSLARTLGVSRQVIVTDIALIRATRDDIVSTSAGYTIPARTEGARKIFKVAHTDEQILDELSSIVERGGRVLDVFIQHKVYGTISAPLNIASKRDVENFLSDLRSGVSTPLKNITGNFHYHTVEARNEKALSEIEDVLRQKGYLIESKDSEAVYEAKDYAQV